METAPLVTQSACCGCGVVLPDIEGPTHRYMTSSPACWAAFGAVLAREYSDRGLDTVHRLSVDTYAVQHPGDRSPQCVQSVAVHLCRLCVILEGGFPIERANAVMLQVKQIEHRFTYLEPPTSRADITVKDVVDAVSVDAHRAKVRQWALSAWNAWSVHHETIRRWLPMDFKNSPR